MKTIIKKDLVLFLGKITAKHISGVRDAEKYLNRKLKIVLLTSAKSKISSDVERQLYAVIRTNLTRIDLIEKQLLPYHQRIVAIISKWENMMPLYGRLTVLFPYLKNPTPHSLMLANDKIAMRKAFKKYVPKTAPKFVIVRDAKRATLDLIKKNIKFPCIIKPASLSKSQLVINCYYREELKATLEHAIKKIQVLYRQNKVEHEPKILVEQLMEGSLYSYDVYINSLGKLYFTPVIEIKTGKDIGHDDFFMYLQMTPANLGSREIEEAQGVIRQGIHALGLRSCTAHAEFYKTKAGNFKIVEIASRTGGFREELLFLAYGIRHHMNDLLIRLGKKPVIKPTKKKYIAFMKFWPTKPGKLKAIKGFKKNSERKFVIASHQQKKPGEYVGFSKFGHSYICSFYVSGKDRSELLGNVRKIEKSLSFTIK